MSNLLSWELILFLVIFIKMKYAVGITTTNMRVSILPRLFSQFFVYTLPTFIHIHTTISKFIPIYHYYHPLHQSHICLISSYCLMLSIMFVWHKGTHSFLFFILQLRLWILYCLPLAIFLSRKFSLRDYLPCFYIPPTLATFYRIKNASE